MAQIEKFTAKQNRYKMTGKAKGNTQPAQPRNTLQHSTTLLTHNLCPRFYCKLYIQPNRDISNISILGVPKVGSHFFMISQSKKSINPKNNNCESCPLSGHFSFFKIPAFCRESSPLHKTCPPDKPDTPKANIFEVYNFWCPDIT